MTRAILSCLTWVAILLPVTAPADQDLHLHEVTGNVYAIVGSLDNRNSENLGNNATFGVVVTPEGVVLIDPGATWQGAQKLHAMIRSITNKPVVTVINTGGQDHRWLGNDYYRRLGARIIANEAAVHDQRQRFVDQFSALSALVGESGVQGTNAAYADQTFVHELRFRLGGVSFHLRHAGAAHTPGDSFVWLPDSRVLFSGDIVYTERLPSIGAQSSSKSWLQAYRAMAEFDPIHLVPGHGRPTTLQQADTDTRGYLEYLRTAVADFMASGGDISEVARIDQSSFAHLRNFSQLAGRNAQRVYEELEWE